MHCLGLLGQKKQANPGRVIFFATMLAELFCRVLALTASLIKLVSC
jgi:hypothetical protein